MKLRSIQFLRAVAAILVVYAHSIDTQMGFSHSFQQSFFHLENFGAFGVDIFFVISGFIISYSAGKYSGMREGGTFLVHRFRRINPVYYVATIPLLLDPLYRLWRHQSIDFTTGNIIKSITLLPITDHTRWINTILFQAWTLSFEWFFYLLFVISIISRVRRKEYLLWTVSAVLLITGCFLSKGADYRLDFITNPIFLEFMLGVGIYWYYKNNKVTKTQATQLVLAGAGICIAEIIRGFGNISEMPYTVDGSLAFLRAVLWGIPAGLLVAGFLFLETNGALNFTRHPLVILLGDASYSIYLTNLFVLFICETIYHQLGFFPQPDLAIWLQLLVVVGIGVLFYKWVELPLIRRLKKGPGPGGPKGSGNGPDAGHPYSGPTAPAR